MTCIIGHRDGWMVADQRVTFGPIIGPYEVRKIKRGPGILVGTAGESLFGSLVQDAMESGNIAPGVKGIVDLVRGLSEPEGNAMVLTRGGIWEVDSAGCSYRIESPWWAIGSGNELAQGWLAAVSDMRPVTLRDAQAAIAFAATRLNNVGHGTQVEHL